MSQVSTGLEREPNALKKFVYWLIPPIEANIQLLISVGEARQRLNGLSGQNIAVEEEWGWFGKYTLTYRVRAHKAGWQIGENFPWFLSRNFPCQTKVSLSDESAVGLHLVTWPHQGKLLMFLLIAPACLLLLLVPDRPIWLPVFLALFVCFVTVIGSRTENPRTALRHKRALLHALGLKLVGDAGEPYRAPYM